MTDALLYLFVFLAMTALDFAWAFYTRACADGRAFVAASWAAGLIVLSGAAQIGYTHDPYLLVPAALGAFVGTWSALRLTKQ